VTIQELIRSLTEAKAKRVVIVEITIDGETTDWDVNDLLASRALLNSLIRQAGSSALTVTHTNRI
jgi:hypothetical protein